MAIAKGALLRRPRRDPRQPHDRAVRALQHAAPAARVAARGARLDRQPRPARDRICQPRVAWLDAVEPLPEAVTAQLPDGGLDVRFEGRLLRATAGGSPVLCDLDLEIAAEPIVAVRRDRARASPRCSTCSARFYDPGQRQRARRRRRGVPDLRKADLRTAVALVTQRPGPLTSLPAAPRTSAPRDPEATEEEMIAACEVAGGGGVHRRPPDGYDTLIGERGVNPRAGRPARRARPRSHLGRPRARARRPSRPSTPRTEEQIVRRCGLALAGSHRCCSRASACRPASWPTEASCSRTA